jgi:hypothetical protein
MTNLQDKNNTQHYLHIESIAIENTIWASVVVHTYISSTGEAAAGRSRVQGQ